MAYNLWTGAGSAIWPGQLERYGDPRYTPIPLADILRQIGKTREEVEATHDRPIDSLAPDSAQAPEGAVPMWSQILEMVGGGGASGSKTSASSRSINPYAAVLKELRRQYGQQGAQADQNIADIQSWFGQLGGMWRKAGKQTARSNRRAARDNTRMNRNMLEGVADPNVARSLGAYALNDSAYLAGSGANERAFDRRMAVDADRQSAYQALVQQRLGAQAQSDIRAQMAQARAQRSQYQLESQSAAANASGERVQTLLSMLGLLPEQERLAMLGIPDIPEAGAEGAFDTDAREGLYSALSDVPAFGVDEDKMPQTNFPDFNSMLNAYRAAAIGQGLDFSDPAQLQAFRAMLAGYALPQWNAIARGREGMMQYGPAVGGFRQIGE